MNTHTNDAEDRLAKSAPALLAALQKLMNGAWPYLTTAQQEDAMAAIEAHERAPPVADEPAAEDDLWAGDDMMGASG